MELTLKTSAELLPILEKRFYEHLTRHKDVEWQEVADKLAKRADLIKKVAYLEATQGEPDVAVLGDELVFVDFSKETPKGRKSLCYDKEARVNRKKVLPASSVIEECEKWDVKLLTEDEYRELQGIEKFDLKTSSWIKTPEVIRSLDGALFCDNRYDHVFVYHNGADSYYSSQAFRAKVVLK